MSLKLHNDSPVAGEATIFLFVRDPVASVARPLLELKDVQNRPRGRERQDAKWRLPVAALAFVGPSLDLVLEPGRFELHVGQARSRAAF